MQASLGIKDEEKLCFSALAMERCANVGGAMMELLRMHGRGPADE